MSSSSTENKIFSNSAPSWDQLITRATTTETGSFLSEQESLRALGEGLPHTDAKIRLFGTTEKPRVTYYRDTAAWCPYCQKVWILLEEKCIPYEAVKINMRSYGDKPKEFLRMVPNGLLPAITIDNGGVQTESLDIMLTLDSMFTGPEHKPMWPAEGSSELQRAKSLMRLERQLFSHWCGLVFRPSMGGGSRRAFEDSLDEVERQLQETDGPWFLSDLSIVDLTYVTHIERMCASVPYWSGFTIRGRGSQWPSIDRWLSAFEEMPSYMATKSDYYTHVMDIPPQYGPGYSVPGSESLASSIDGRDGSWQLPLRELSLPEEQSVQPVRSENDPGPERSRWEAAYKLARNHEPVARFALRGAGSPGAKQFQAPLADPYAVPALEHFEDMDTCLRHLVAALLEGHEASPRLELAIPSSDEVKAEGIEEKKKALQVSLAYLRDRIGVPRDMSYPAARQLRAHLNWMIDQIYQAK